LVQILVFVHVSVQDWSIFLLSFASEAQGHFGHFFHVAENPRIQSIYRLSFFFTDTKNTITVAAATSQTLNFFSFHFFQIKTNITQKIKKMKFSSTWTTHKHHHRSEFTQTQNISQVSKPSQTPQKEPKTEPVFFFFKHHHRL